MKQSFFKPSLYFSLTSILSSPTASVAKKEAVSFTFKIQLEIYFERHSLISLLESIFLLSSHLFSLDFFFFFFFFLYFLFFFFIYYYYCCYFFFFDFGFTLSPSLSCFLRPSFIQLLHTTCLYSFIKVYHCVVIIKRWIK